MPATAKTPQLEVSQYYVFSTSNGLSFQVRRGQSPAKDTSTGARWNTINRPRRVSMTVWDGDDPRTMDVPILFDHFTSGDTIETLVSTLDSMRWRSGSLTRPPTVKIQGALPIDGVTWVIQGIDWGDSVIYDDEGFRVRQDAVVHLIEYHAGTSLKVTQPKSGVIVYHVKKGDTIRSIAKKFYGSSAPRYVRNILRTNNIRDPKHLPKTIKIYPMG